MSYNKIKFKIGEFSRLNRVTIKTLRHYEEIGLLIPYEIDEWTGYRYYDITQFQQMSVIVYLKRLGFSLEEIKNLADNGRQLPDQQSIIAKISQCEAEQKKFEWQHEQLNRLVNSLQKQEKMENIFIKSLPAIIVASHRRNISGYHELFNLCPNVIGPEMYRLGCTCPEPGYGYTIEHNKEYNENNIDIEYCEEVCEKRENSELIQFKDVPAVETAVCMNHKGSYEAFPETFAHLFEYVEQHGYKVTGDTRYSYIDGIWNKESEEEWLTEIQIPVSQV